jgi:NAD(P)H-quinone oxidoreductase subunit 5
MPISAYMNIDSLSWSIVSLVCFIGLAVGSFALRYLRGDTQYHQFFIFLGLLTFFIGFMASTDHLLMLLVSFGINNYLLVQLMIHKSSWKEAKASGILASKNFLFGYVCLIISFCFFYGATGESSIQLLIHHAEQSVPVLLGLIFLILGAMAQSAIWPFHRWLISSLNSPTPVSAIMHAGLINGGGFLLIRFAPLLLEFPLLLNFIFIMGMMTAGLGTLWKLLQQDVKRMLACSTMGQMGFMFVQCGLGLFPAALIHLCAHGLFKAYLFLASGSAAQEKRLDLSFPPTKLSFSLALLCGLAASFCFNQIGLKPWFVADTRFFITVLVCITGCQTVLPLINSSNSLKRFSIALLLACLVGSIYGVITHNIELLLEPLQVMQPQPLHLLHGLGIAVLVIMWLSMLFMRQRTKEHTLSRWQLKFYVMALNQSQPHPATITTNRNHYKYL